MAKRRFSFVVLISAFLAARATEAAHQSVSFTCHAVKMLTRDGTKLHTQIYQPTAPGLYPVILIRNPYAFGSTYSNGCTQGFDWIATRWAEEGYVAVLQEVRGTGKSEGIFVPFLQEQQDGYDAIEWAATQPWSNGKVATTSMSYLGATQWQAAITSPPHLVAISPAITGADYHDDWIYRNGVPDLLFAINWGLGFAPEMFTHQLRRQGVPDGQIVRQSVALNGTLVRSPGDWLSMLPLSKAWSSKAERLTPFVFEWLKHPTYDSYWSSIDVERHFQDVKVPALITGAWSDLFYIGTIRSYLGMKTEAGTPQARSGTMLVMECCGHAAMGPQQPGQISWGENRLDSTLTERFMDHHVKGLDNGIDKEPHVHLTVLVPPDTGTKGDNFVVKADSYPLPGTKAVALYLLSGGHANSASGDGVLVSADATMQNGGYATDKFVYDPQDPVPSVGGVDGDRDFAAGALDQTSVETRDDVLVYTDSKLSQDLAAVGPVTVELWAQSSAPDTDFTAKLVDVHPDGYAHNVVDRIVRARYRGGSKLPPSLIEPGKAYKYTIEMGDIATVFRKGHRIRLEISSSNFPHYARNLNTGKSNEDTSEMLSATQTIFHDPTHPSKLVLSVAPGIATTQ